jgi:AraC-like DNA-binding protein
VRDLVSTVIWLAALQGAVLAPVLWARRANRLANRILAVLVAAVALMLISGDVGARFGFSGHPHLLGLGAPLPFLFSPLLYLYIVALTRPITRFDPRWLAHALPFLGALLFFAQAFYFHTAEEKLALAKISESGAPPISLRIFHAIEILQAVVYLSLGWRELTRYGRKMHGYFSDLTRIDLRWLETLVLAHVAVWSIVVSSIILRAVTGASVGLGIVEELGSACVVFLTGYVSLWQPELVEKATDAKIAEEPPSAPPTPPSAPRSAPSAPEPEPPPKYRRNRLDDAEARDLATKLETLMREKQLYREPALTLPRLADELGITPHTLSQILNVRIGKTFFAFVNAHRAEALEEALADPSKADRGVLDLGLEVGFTSKSTLNSAFKKHAGMTPTEFRARKRAATSRG